MNESSIASMGEAEVHHEDLGFLLPKLQVECYLHSLLDSHDEGKFYALILTLIILKVGAIVFQSRDALIKRYNNGSSQTFYIVHPALPSTTGFIVN